MSHAIAPLAGDSRMTHDTPVIEVGLVEPVGIEPTTFALQTRRSPS
jgi:hypothetical protein